MSTRQNVITNAAQLMADHEEFNEYHENEYNRGMVELIVDTFGTPFHGDDLQVQCQSVWEEIKAERKRFDEEWNSRHQD